MSDEYVTYDSYELHEGTVYVKSITELREWVDRLEQQIAVVLPAGAVVDNIKITGYRVYDTETVGVNVHYNRPMTAAEKEQYIQDKKAVDEAKKLGLTLFEYRALMKAQEKLSKA